MPRYRKKPVIVEAVQFKRDWKAAGMTFPRWLIDAIAAGVVELDELGGGKINTLEGAMNIAHEDYIIKGVKGEIYPCKPDIFDATYEPTTDKPWTPPKHAAPIA
jgi:hypothetical protein